VADLNVAIRLSATDQASPTIAKVTREVAGIGPAAEKSNSALSGLTGMLGKVGVGALGVTALIGSVTGLASALSGPILAASDLDESMNKVNVVFGDSAKTVTDFAKTAATCLGQSRQQALEAAGTFGNLFTSMGLGQADAAKLSTEIVGLGSDLASFNNIRPEEALEKLRSGLIGESEPLRSLGVNLNEAAVAAQAVKMGLAADVKSVSDAAKVQARYALILQQTKNAQGDFKNTSTGMANSMRVINAAVGDLQADIGGRLLPVVAPLVSRLATELPRAMDALGPVLDGVGAGIGRVVAGFSQLTGIVQTAAAALQGGDLVGVLSGIRATLLEQAGTWGQALLGWAEDVVPPLLEKLGVLGGRVVDWAIAAAPGLIDAFGSWALAGIDWVIEATRKALPVLGNFLSRVLDWVGDNAPRLLERFVGEWVPAAIVWVGKAAIKTVPELVKLIGAVGGWLVDVGVPKLLDLGGKLGLALVRGLVTGVGHLAEALGAALYGELAAIRVDVGPFHLSAAGFYVDAPRMPTIALPGLGGAQPAPATGGGGAVAAFAHGGAFRVGGSGGTDSQMVAFRASPGELVAVGQPRRLGQGGGGGVTVNGPLVHVGSVSVRSDEDVDRLADAIEQRMIKGLRSARLSGVRYPLGVSAGAT
jgi:hypothetical protein